MFETFRSNLFHAFSSSASMAVFFFPCTSSSSPSLSVYASSSLSFKPIFSINPKRAISAKIPARDRVIDFGKHKGQMLGALPSKYLKWVSKNLRARDYEEWAKLADEVLQDPYYKDRLEWELAEKILQGNDPRGSRSEHAVSDLLEISERFSWDNDDKVGWEKVEFALLGTSKSGRIPRVRASKEKMGISKVQHMGSLKKDIELKGRSKFTSFSADYSGRSPPPSEERTFSSGKKKVGFLRVGFRYYDVDEESFEKESVRGKREERREKQRLKRGTQMQKVRMEIEVNEDEGAESKKQIQQRRKLNPFPGREAFLGKIRKQD